jgi:hypothetical protein
MREQANTRTARGTPKEEVTKRARQGLFDHNPLLASPHFVVCNACGSSRRITYLSYVKSGRFELGETQTIEVPYAAPTASGLGRTIEQITPILLTIACNKCGAEILWSPVSVEYLLFTATKPQQLKDTYV